MSFTCACSVSKKCFFVRFLAAFAVVFVSVSVTVVTFLDFLLFCAFG